MTAPPVSAAAFVIGAVVLTSIVHLLIWRRLIVKAWPVRTGRTVERLFIGLAALLPAGMILLLFMRHLPRWVDTPLMTAIFFWAGIVIFLVWAVVAFEVLRPVLRSRSAAQIRLARGCIAAALAVAAYATLQAARGTRVVTTRFEVPEVLADYRIVLLTDLHIGHTLGAGFAKAMVQAVNPLGADLIVVGGDMVDGSVPALAEAISPLRQLHARDGVIFVLGNHEYLSGADSWARYIRTFGWNVLRNERLRLPDLDVVGLDDERQGSDSLLKPDPRKVTIVVAHEPVAFKDACRMGADLALAGHTHGDQIFPIGLVDWIQDGYLAGRYRCGRTNLYVSSGAGFWGPPMRLGSRSEISLIELVGSAP